MGRVLHTDHAGIGRSVDGAETDRQPARALAKELYERRVLAAMAVLHEAEVTVRDKHGAAVLRAAPGAVSGVTDQRGARHCADVRGVFSGAGVPDGRYCASGSSRLMMASATMARMKAADIPDMAIYEAIAATGRNIALIWDLTAALPQFPEKVVQAKCRQMIAKGRLNGCPCGCRGDFRFPWQAEICDPVGSNWRARLAEWQLVRVGGRS